MDAWFQQSGFTVCFEWGAVGLERLLASCHQVVIVDALSFTTCVSVAVDVGAIVFPFPWKDHRAAEFACREKAILAGSRKGGSSLSLSPVSLKALRPSDRLVLPSPNGSQLCTQTGSKPTIAACLRNACAVGGYVNALGGRTLVVAAGERWPIDGSLRLAWEDFIVAGAVISSLAGTKSPEAQAAENSWNACRGSVKEAMRQCASGRELTSKGFAEDVDLAAEVDVSTCVPVLQAGGFFMSENTRGAKL